MIAQDIKQIIKDNIQAQEPYLDLSYCGVQVLPKEIGQLAHLKKLDISGNHLTSLPPELGRLTSLEVLDVSGNQVGELPSEISELQKLQVLDLSLNPLGYLPEEIGALSTLRHLEVYGANLRQLPESIGKLKQLVILDLAKNSLISLPESLGQLSDLQSLDLLDNRLTSLPMELEYLDNLSTLLIEGNELDISFDTNIGNTYDATTIIRYYFGKKNEQDSQGLEVSRDIDDIFDTYQSESGIISVKKSLNLGEVSIREVASDLISIDREIDLTKALLSAIELVQHSSREDSVLGDIKDWLKGWLEDPYTKDVSKNINDGRTFSAGYGWKINESYNIRSEVIGVNSSGDNDIEFRLSGSKEALWLLTTIWATRVYLGSEKGITKEQAIDRSTLGLPCQSVCPTDVDKDLWLDEYFYQRISDYMISLQITIDETKNEVLGLISRVLALVSSPIDDNYILPLRAESQLN